MKQLLMLLVFISPVFVVHSTINEYSTSLEFAQVNYVSAYQKSNNQWCFSVTIEHNDQSWEHYADGWEVVDLQGNILANRVLAHPHDNEQPFTRSLCGIEIPQGINKLIVRAKCNQHGFEGKSVIVDLHMNETDEYSLQPYNQ